MANEEMEIEWEREGVREEDYITKEMRLKGWYYRLKCRKCNKVLIEYYTTSDWGADQLLYTQQCPHFEPSEWTESSVDYAMDYKDSDPQARVWYKEYIKEKKLAIEIVRVDKKYIFILPRRKKTK